MTGWEATLAVTAHSVSLYKGSGRYYDRGRLPYPVDLPDALTRLLDLNGKGRLIDVGCGTGAVTLLLAPLFAETVGVDPDREMLDVARAKARAAPQLNVSFLRLRAEDLPAGLGKFSMATFALSFHWTARKQVAATIHDMLDEGGWFVKINRSQPLGRRQPRHLPEPPMDEIRQLIRTYVGDLTKPEPSDDSAVLVAAGFLPPVHAHLPGGAWLERSIDDVVAKVYSQADYAPHLFGDRLPDFERDLRRLLVAAAPHGRFVERQPDCELVMWQRP